jgi:hypothetical protein
MGEDGLAFVSRLQGRVLPVISDIDSNTFLPSMLGGHFETHSKCKVHLSCYAA